MKAKKKKTIKELEKTLKRVLYPKVKQRDGNVCISCGTKGLVGQNWHCGHFIKAEVCNLEYRYNEFNLNSQCGRCNKWLAGNFVEYEKAMIIKYGQEVVDDLKANYNRPLAIEFDSRSFLLDKISYYKGKGQL